MCVWGCFFGIFDSAQQRCPESSTMAMRRYDGCAHVTGDIIYVHNVVKLVVSNDDFIGP